MLGYGAQPGGTGRDSLSIWPQFGERRINEVV